MSSAECRVHLVGVNRLSACRKFFVVHSWQKLKGTRCRDGVNVCCGVHILFGWFLRVASLHALVFLWKTFFVTCFCCSFLVEMVREKRGGKGEDYTLCKV